MNDNTSIIIPDASALTVDTSCIDVSEVVDQEDKEFLQQKGENILRIVARAALEVGRELVEIQAKYKEEKQVGLGKFYQSIGISSNQAQHWANKYRALCAYVEIFGEEGANEKLNGLADRAASQLWNLPRDYREAFLADIALGQTPTLEEVSEVSSRSEVKLTKAQELLEAAKQRQEKHTEKWELAKADPAIKHGSPEYTAAHSSNAKAVQSVNRYEQRIAELQQQIEEERFLKEEQAKKVDKAKAELEQFKHDSEAAREEKVKRLTTSLTMGVPQVMADLQKFFPVKDHFPQEVKDHLLQQATYLANYIGDQL